FGDQAERPRWLELLRYGVAIFDLDYDAILVAIYALSVSAEDDCYLCVPPNPGIEAAALGASESALPGTAPAEALHTFTLDSGASRCFFRNSTTLTPLSAPVPVRLDDPSGGPVLAHSSTVLPCPAVPSGSLSSLHLPSFSTNLVSTAALQDAMVTTTTPGGQRVSICTCTRTGRHLATFSRRPGSSLLFCGTTAVVTPSLPRLHGMHSCLLVSSLPRSLPPLPPLPAPPCLPSFCRGEGILQSFTLPDSPQQNGIAERRIGLIMEVARTSMIHAAAPHFLWPFVVQYAAHQLNLWDSCAFVRDTSTDKLSARASPCVFLGFPPDAPGWHFYHPTSRRVFPSQDVTFDESIPFYRLFPYHSAPPPPLPLFLDPGPPPIDPLPPQGLAPSGVSQVDPLPGIVPVEVAVDSGASRGVASGGAESEGAESGGAKHGGAEPAGGAESAGAEPGDAEPLCTTSSGGPVGASPRLSPRPEPPSPQQLRECFTQRTRLRSAAAAGPGGACTRGTGAAGTGSVGGAGAGDPTKPGAAGTSNVVLPHFAYGEPAVPLHTERGKAPEDTPVKPLTPHLQPRQAIH
ncbi:unnamed protein product, partial [Closterium sp. NIES-53]